MAHTPVNSLAICRLHYHRAALYSALEGTVQNQAGYEILIAWYLWLPERRSQSSHGRVHVLHLGLAFKVGLCEMSLDVASLYPHPTVTHHTLQSFVIGQTQAEQVLMRGFLLNMNECRVVRTLQTIFLHTFNLWDDKVPTADAGIGSGWKCCPTDDGSGTAASLFSDTCFDSTGSTNPGDPGWCRSVAIGELSPS